MNQDPLTLNREHEARMEQYYQFHARMYDATRWRFLSGRSTILQHAARLSQPQRVLEVGCGTGRNLCEMSRLFPQAELTGLDIAAAMLQQAEQKLRPRSPHIHLQQGDYGQPLRGDFDLVLFSYSLTMMNPGWESVLRTALADLRPGGHLAVVDFHDSHWPIFKQWMSINHVRLNGHIQPVLQNLFSSLLNQTIPAYLGLWYYLLFVGVKPE